MGKPRPPIERLLEKLTQTETGCWEWTAHLSKCGYARLWIDGKNVGAHRWSYEYHIAPIPDGLEIDHLCRNRACVNPWHLEPVTTAENVRRSTVAEAARARGGRITECPQGHPYSEENTYLNGGSRVCLICKRERARDHYLRNREAVIRRAAEWRLNHINRSRELSREAQRRYRAKKKVA